MYEHKELAVTKQEIRDVLENREEEHEVPASPGVMTSRSIAGLIAKDIHPIAEEDIIKEE